MMLTLKSRAGIGVKRLMWIMHRTLGRWPSLEPTKNNLQQKKKVKKQLKPDFKKGFSKVVGIVLAVLVFTDLEAAMMEELRPP